MMTSFIIRSRKHLLWQPWHTTSKSRAAGKKRICIRIDTDLLNHFQKEAAKSAKSEHPVAYQAMINEALRSFRGCGRSN